MGGWRVAGYLLFIDNPLAELSYDTGTEVVEPVLEVERQVEWC
jgi:hypothetical protein